MQNLNEHYENEIPIIYLGKKIASFVVLPSKQSSPMTTTQARLKQKSKDSKKLKAKKLADEVDSTQSLDTPVNLLP